MTRRNDNTPGFVVAGFALVAALAFGGWVLEVLAW